MALSTVNYSNRSLQTISGTYSLSNIYTGYYPIHPNISFGSYNINSYNINRSITYSNRNDDTSIYSDNDDDPSSHKKQLEKCAPTNQQEENTQSHQNERQWFSILMNWVRPNNSAPHVVEWKHKCVGEMQPDGSLMFLYSMNTIKYDGENFLIFDEKKKVWVPLTENAKQIERKLDRDEGLKEFIMGYMKNKCMNLLKVFVYCENKQQKKPPPEVHVFAKNSIINANLILICLATGFITKKIIMRIKRNGRVLTEDDGLKSSGVVLNSDNSYQRRDQVEILKSDVAEYSCEVILEESNVRVTKDWDHKIPPKRPFGIETPLIVLIGFIVFLFIGVPLVLMVCPRFRRGHNNRQGGPRVVVVPPL